MTRADLATKLHEMYFGAPKDEQVAMIHLFSIKFASELSEIGVSAKEMAVAAGLPESYGTEINKGIKLAKYVVPKAG